MTRAYTDKDAIEKYLLRDIDASFDTQLAAWIEAMTLEVEKITNRRFARESETPEVLYYDGNGKTEIIIDEFTSITEIATGDEYGANFEVITDAIKYPRIAGDNTCYWKLYLTSGFPIGIQNIRVTGILGHDVTVPANIKFATTVLVAGIINATQNITGKKSESIGNYQVTYADDKQAMEYEQAKAILASSTRMYL